MTELGRLLLVALFTVGAVLGPIVMLNARDRRHARLLETMWCLAPRDLRHLITIDVRCSLLGRGSAVEVDMRDCSREQIWDALPRWCAGLAPGVRLLVLGSVDRHLGVSVTSKRASGLLDWRVSWPR